MKNKILIILTIILCASVSAAAQAASNPPFILDQSVIVGGGTTNSAGGTFKLDGTIGEAAAKVSDDSQMSVRSGFLNATPPVSNIISGRVLTLTGGGLKSARVVLTGEGGKTFTAFTGASVFYRFTGIPAGQTYIINVESRRYQFAAQTVFVAQKIENLDLLAQSAK